MVKDFFIFFVLVLSGAGPLWWKEPRNLKVFGKELLIGFFCLGLSFLFVFLRKRFFLGLPDEETYSFVVLLLASVLFFQSFQRFLGHAFYVWVPAACLFFAFLLEKKMLGPLQPFCPAGIIFGLPVARFVLIGIMDKLEFSLVPKSFWPVPIFFISLGFLAMIAQVFSGFIH